MMVMVKRSVANMMVIMTKMSMWFMAPIFQVWWHHSWLHWVGCWGWQLRFKAWNRTTSRFREIATHAEKVERVNSTKPLSRDLVVEVIIIIVIIILSSSLSSSLGSNSWKPLSSELDLHILAFKTGFSIRMGIFWKYWNLFILWIY